MDRRKQDRKRHRGLNWTLAIIVPFDPCTRVAGATRGLCEPSDPCVEKLGDLRYLGDRACRRFYDCDWIQMKKSAASAAKSTRKAIFQKLSGCRPAIAPV